MDNSYRIFNCAYCHKQTKICRPCDRGNSYCSEACSKSRRKQSLCAIRQRNQNTFHGKLLHAARQKKYRQTKKVTDQGTRQGPSHGFLNMSTKQEVSQAISLQPETKVEEKTSLILLQLKPEAPDLVRCDICGNWCGPFARQKFWHGGRNYKKLRRKYRDSKREGGRDSPLAPCGRLATKHNR